MADSKSSKEENDNTKKRTRSSTSSTGSTSGPSSNETKQPKKKSNKEQEESFLKTNKEIKKSEKSVPEKQRIESIKESNEQEQMKDSLAMIQTQLTEIKGSLTNVLTKNDDSLKFMIKDIIKEMKEELLKTVDYKIDLLESKLFEKDEEINKQNEKIEKLSKRLEEQEADYDTLKFEFRKQENRSNELFNNTEQYSRINNIRINGIPEKNNDNKNESNENKKQDEGTELSDQKDETKSNEVSNIEEVTMESMESPSYAEVARRNPKGLESPEETRDLVIKTLNEKLPGLNLKKEDIDTCHRLGKKSEGKGRQIIVRFKSRLTKDAIMRRKKNLPKPLFVSEDLTKRNHHVLMCVKNKMPDEVDKCWTLNGKIYYKDKVGNIKQVHYNDYENWIDLPWPEK
jgi:hypothetical protein